MSLWAKIFKPKDQTTKPVTIGTRMEQTPYSKYLSLLKSLNGIGLPKQPLLRQNYDPISRMPCIDFSYWISEQLISKDYIALWLFVNAYFDDKAPDPDTTGEESLVQVLAKSYSRSSHSNIQAAIQELKLRTSQNERELKHQGLPPEIEFNKFIGKDFRRYLEISDKAILDIQSFFIVNAGIGSLLREFWIAEGKQSLSLAKVLSVYSFEIHREPLKELISTANTFLKSMKNDKLVDYWDQYPYFRVSNINESYKISVKTDLLTKLQSLGIGERLHFFDFVKGLPDPFWAGDSSFTTRRIGVLENASLQKMVNLEIFIRYNGLESVPAIIKKAELTQRAASAGIYLKKSWDFKAIYEFLLSTGDGKAVLDRIIKEKNPVKLNNKYKEDIESILAYQNKILPIANLLSMI